MASYVRFLRDGKIRMVLKITLVLSKTLFVLGQNTNLISVTKPIEQFLLCYKMLTIIVRILYLIHERNAQNRCRAISSAFLKEHSYLRCRHEDLSIDDGKEKKSHKYNQQHNLFCLVNYNLELKGLKYLIC
jgi:hypothetical protein